MFTIWKAIIHCLAVYAPGIFWISHKRAEVILRYIYYLKSDHPLFGGGAPARIIHCLAVAHRVDFDHLTRFFVKIVKKQGLKSSTFIYPRPERKNVKRQGSKRSSKAFFLWDNKKISGAKKEEERQTMQTFNDFLARFVVWIGGMKWNFRRSELSVIGTDQGELWHS